MAVKNSRKDARRKRRARIRKKIRGTAETPRLSVFRSARHMYAQLIDDISGVTLVAASSVEAKVREEADFADASGKIAKAAAIGKIVARRAQDKGLKKVVFDRNGFLYHGRVKALADGAREAGLDF
ncbi:MAG: 50S ribosomal protein L18 [Desulfococcus sp.]|nr:MAG: 50S ribosomal protein L18 [Desulfococcus sp.]